MSRAWFFLSFFQHINSIINPFQCDQIGHTVGNFLKHLATIILPKSPTFLGNFCKGVEIYHFSSEIIFGQLLWTIDDFFLVTLTPPTTATTY